MKLFSKLVSLSSSVNNEPKSWPRKSRARQHLEALISSDGTGKGKLSRKKTLNSKQRHSWLKGNPFTINKCELSSSEAEHVLVRGKFSSKGELKDWTEQPEFFEDDHLYDTNGSDTFQAETSFDSPSNCSLDTASTAFLGDMPCDMTSHIWSDCEDFGTKHSDTCEFCRSAQLPKSQLSTGVEKLSTVLYFSKLLHQSSNGRLTKEVGRSVSCQTLVNPAEETGKAIEEPKPYTFNGYVELAFL